MESTQNITSANEEIIFQIYTESVSLTPVHWEKAITIFHILRGELEISISSRRTVAYEDECFLINPWEPYETKCLHGCQYLFLQIPLDYIEKYLPQIRQLSFGWDIRTKNRIKLTKIQRLKETLRQMQIIWEIQPDGYEIRFQSLLLDLLFQLYHNFSREVTSKGAHREDILDFLQSSLMDNSSLKDRDFYRLFRKTLGMPYSDYQNQLRLSQVCKDMLNTDTPTSQLLERYGIKDIRSFRKNFYNCFKDTPENFRERYVASDSKILL